MATGLRTACVVLTIGLASSTAATAGSTVAPAPDIQRVSVGQGGQQIEAGSRLSETRSITAHGERVVFQTSASLVPEDTNGQDDVYLRDLVDGTTTLVSVATDGDVAVGGSSASISQDGNRVAFLSDASLVPADTDDDVDAYVRTLVSGTTILVSGAKAGLAGRGETAQVELSGDSSTAVLLTTQRLLRKDTDPPDVESFKKLDVYAVNVNYGWMRLISVDRGGRSFAGPVGLGGVAYDGRRIGFRTTLPDVRRVPAGFWVYYSGKPRTRLVWREDVRGHSFALPGTPAVSGNGRFIALPTARRDVDDEGRRRLLDLVRFDIRTDRRVLICCAEGSRYADAYNPLHPTLSRRGGRVAFTLEEGGTAADDNDWDDVYLADIPQGRRLRLVSHTTSDAGNGSSGVFGVGISADGRHVAFSSFATDLVADDTNDALDVFAWNDAS